MPQYLVLLETSGNQKYIFATNKLRENVGASEITYRAGTEWWGTTKVAGVTEILATSGKAYLLAPDEATARSVIKAATTKALKDAPGLDLGGVFVEVDHGKIGPAIRDAHELLTSRRGLTPGPEARFQRLPVVAECGTSGLPAAEYDDDPPEKGPRAAEVLAKRLVAGAGFKRVRDIAWNTGRKIIAFSADKLTPDAPDPLKGKPWLAVVHADGNGLGQVFLNFEKYVPAGADFAATLRSFSHALDACTFKAFDTALGLMPAEEGAKFLPVVPIVLGGDDMTVVMDGRHAVQFAADFLAAFEEATAENRVVMDVMKAPVTACAGVAVVGSHYPFSAAYDLSESLIKSAKAYAKGLNADHPPSAIDFHVLYDASGADLTRMRDELTLDGGKTNLVARPYLVNDKTEGPRSMATMLKRVETIAEKADGRRTLPNSQLHALREALFLGREAATSRYDLIRERYTNFEVLFPNGLFWSEGDDFRTHLLDALEISGLSAARGDDS